MSRLGRTIPFSLAAVLWLCGVSVHSQSRQYVRIKERPVVRFDEECTRPDWYQPKFDWLIKRLLTMGAGPGIYGDRAFVYDLNGDQKKEFFIPLDCGGTGNCRWAIVAAQPVRLLGVLWGETFYLHQRISRWRRITLTSHLNVSESMIDTYAFRRGRYRQFGRGYLASAYIDNFPRSLLTVEPLCDPIYVPGSIDP